jgi:hypothetical protein
MTTTEVTLTVMKMVEALIVVRKAKDITIITAIIAVDRLTKISNSTTITTVSQQAMRLEGHTNRTLTTPVEVLTIAIVVVLAAIIAVGLLTAAVAAVEDTEVQIAIKKY